MTKGIVRACLWLAAFAGALAILLAVNARAVETLPDALEYAAAASVEGGRCSRVSFDRLRQARETVGSLAVVSGRTDQLCRATGADTPADYGEIRLARTDEYYPSLHKLRFVSGGWFGSPDACTYENVCVLPDTLALRAFRSTDVLGAPISLGGVICRIVGVYATDGGLLARYASDGYELAFAPEYMRPDGADDGVALLYLRDKKTADPAETLGETDDQSAADARTKVQTKPQTESGTEGVPESAQTVSYAARTALETALGGGLYFYEQNDYLDRQALARQSIPTLIFLCALCAAVGAIGYLCRAIEDAAAFAREKASAHLSATRREWARALLPPVLLLTGIVLLLVLTVFPPYLPVGFLPDDGRIFDLAHYADIVLRASQRRNFSGVYLYYDNYATAVLWCNAVLIAAGTALFAGLAAAVRRVVKSLNAR